jgi:hypothetical protein
MKLCPANGALWRRHISAFWLQGETRFCPEIAHLQ